MLTKLRLERLDERLVPTSLGVGPDKVGIFRNGVWILDTNQNHVLDAGDATFVYGLPTDTPIVGDWNADGHTKVGVFRNVFGVGQFILDTNGDRVYDAGDDVFYFGLGPDKPVVGDWDATGRTKVGVARNVNGVNQFSLDVNGDHKYGAGDSVFVFGLATDQIVIGDWNGDGRSKIGVVRNNGGQCGHLVDRQQRRPRF